MLPYMSSWVNSGRRSEPERAAVWEEKKTTYLSQDFDVPRTSYWWKVLLRNFTSLDICNKLNELASPF
jgi:hypothetical protein